MIQYGGHHAPAHTLAEFDHARTETVAGLRQVLHEAAGRVVFAGDSVDGGFVTEVAELKGRVRAPVDAGKGDFGWRGLREGCAGEDPRGC